MHACLFVAGLQAGQGQQQRPSSVHAAEHAWAAISLPLLRTK